MAAPQERQNFPLGTFVLHLGQTISLSVVGITAFSPHSRQNLAFAGKTAPHFTHFAASDFCS